MKNTIFFKTKVYLSIALVGVSLNALQAQKIKVSGRLSLDGGVFHKSSEMKDGTFKDGVSVGEALLVFKANITDQFSVKVSPKFEKSEVKLLDALAQYNLDKKNIFRLGNIRHPFAYNKPVSGGAISLIQRPTSTRAFEIARKLGLDYRHIDDSYWVGVGIYSNKDVNKKLTKGDVNDSDKFGGSARFVYKFLPESAKSKFQLGAGFAVLDKGNVTQFTDPSDDENSYKDYYISYAPSSESTISSDKLATSRINHSKLETKFNAEALFYTNRFHVISEYKYVNVSRKNNLGSISHQGFYIQTGIGLTTKEAYGYDQFWSIIKPKGEKFFELVARYDYTDLYDNQSNGDYQSGGFINTYTLGLNYYFTKGIRAMLDYSLMNVKRPQQSNCNLGVVQLRTQFTF